MASIVDNGIGEMPQWKRELIMRRRAQAQAQQAQAQAQEQARERERGRARETCDKAQLHSPATTPSVTSGNSNCNSNSNSNINKQLAPADGIDGRDECAAGGGGGAEAQSVALGCRPPCARCLPLGHQPSAGSAPATAACNVRVPPHPCPPRAHTTCCAPADMVHLHTDSDSSEELQYGPGIVSKLKNRYLSLTLRETAIKRRPSILRKSTSLENLLDEDCEREQEHEHEKHAEKPLQLRLYAPRAASNGTNGNARNVLPAHANRYRSGARGSMKRARSVEAISRIYSPSPKEPATPLQQQQQPLPPQPQPRPKSLHEDFVVNPIITPRVNKPKRLTPVITEREKPPADVVKHTKKIFESRPEARTRPPQHTGEVAAKVASYKTIIIQTKQANTITSKPPIKQKPSVVVPATQCEDVFNVTNITQRKKPNKLNLKAAIINTSPLASPGTPGTPVMSPLSPSLVATQVPAAALTPAPAPGLTLSLNPVLSYGKSSLPSPIPDVSMVHVAFQEEEVKKTSSLSETPDLILHSSPVHIQKELLEKEREKEKCDRERDLEKESVLLQPTPSPTSPLSPEPPSHTPSKIEPLTLDITPFAQSHAHAQSHAQSFAHAHSKPPPPVNNRDPVLVLSPREIEKNAINAAITCNGGGKGNSNSNSLPPPLPPALPKEPPVALAPAPPKAKARKSKQAPAQPDQNCIVFKFTDRKDVPDYIGNDGHLRTQHIPMPKAGEGGITLLPGATIQDVFDEELLSLEGPPSPCDVQFINDNILIDGKSSLSKKSKKSKLRIQFVEAIPQVFEYPSEASMLVEDAPALNQTLGGTTVPSLSGSTLANYTPKVAASEFQLGVTKAPPPPIHADLLGKQEEAAIEHDAPMLFSSGTNADILF